MTEIRTPMGTKLLNQYRDLKALLDEGFPDIEDIVESSIEYGMSNKDMGEIKEWLLEWFNQEVNLYDCDLITTLLGDDDDLDETFYNLKGVDSFIDNLVQFLMEYPTI